MGYRGGSRGDSHGRCRPKQESTPPAADHAPRGEWRRCTGAIASLPSEAMRRPAGHGSKVRVISAADAWPSIGHSSKLSRVNLFELVSMISKVSLARGVGRMFLRPLARPASVST